MTDPNIEVLAPLWVQKDNQKYLGEKRIRLLEQIDIHGSLSTAAKAAGLSYKAAWDALNVMNSLAENPLTIAATGGSGGGGTILTEEGRRIVKLFKAFEQEHRSSLMRLEKTLGDLDHYLPLLQDTSLRVSTKNIRVSTKNILPGTVEEIVRDGTVAQVVLRLSEGLHIYSVIGDDCVDELSLKKGAEAYAMIKASSVMISNAPDRPDLSARNIIPGLIQAVSDQSVLGEVSLDIGGGLTITSTITRNSAQNLNLAKGDRVWAVIKSSSVIIGVD